MSIIGRIRRHRREAGRAEYSPDRLARLSRLYPEIRPEQTAAGQDEKLERMIITVIAAAALLTLVLLLKGSGGAVSSIERPGPGSPAEGVSLRAEMDGAEYDVDTRISSRSYTDTERQEALEEALRELKADMLGDNESPEDIIYPLDFDAECRLPDAEAYWTPGDLRLIDSSGRLSVDARPGDRTLVTLHLIWGETEILDRVYLRFGEPPRDELSETLLLDQAIREADAADPEEPEVRLPQEIGGRQVTFYEERDTVRVLAVPLAAAAVIAALLMLPGQRMKEAEEQRGEELMLSYQEFTAKLAVLVGAGLSLRKAWERMTDDYRRRRDEGGERSALYEEMCFARRLMESGVPEGDAYRRFGDRTGLIEYVRLGNMLDSQMKNGRRQLRTFLTEESAGAYRRRMEAVRRRGEKISAELMMPLMLLFALIMAMIAIPAFMGW